MDYLQTTRGRILASIKRHGSSYPDRIATELEMAATSVRQQLTLLQRDGYVTVREVREGSGRPRLTYRVTPRGDALFRKRYDTFATGVLAAAARLTGDASAVLDAYVEGQVARGKGHVNGLDTRTRMQEVAAVMRDEGGLAEVTDVAGAPCIREPNCVLAAIAAVDPAVCDAHSNLVERLLAVPVAFHRTPDPFMGGCTWTAVSATHASGAAS